MGKRIKDLSRAETEGYLAVDNATNGTGKMNTSVIFNNFAPKFVPNETQAVAKKLYRYQGVLYVAKENYFGEWDATKFQEVNLDQVAFNKQANKKAFANFAAKEIPALSENGEQANVNLFEQIIPLPASTNQYFNKDACVVINAYFGSTLASGAPYRTAIVRVPAGKTYCVSLPTGEYNRFNVALTSEMPYIGMSLTGKQVTGTSGGRTYFKFTAGSTETYILIYYYNGSLDADNESVIRAKIQICEASLPAEQEAYSLKCLTFNGVDPIDADGIRSIAQELVADAVKDNAVYENYLKSLFAGALFDIAEDVTESADLDENPGKFINGIGQIVDTSNGRNVSKAIAFSSTDCYIVALYGASPGVPAVAYYSDLNGTQFVEGLDGGGESASANKQFYALYPKKGYASFRICSKAGNCSVYKINYSAAALVAAISGKLGSMHDSDTIVIDEDVTEQYPLANYHKVIDADGQLNDSSDGGCTNVFPIDFTKKLCITCKMNQYRTGIAFYKDLDGHVLDSIYPRPSSSKDFVNLIIDPPITARSFRLGTTGYATYSVHTFHYAVSSSEDLSERVADVESEVDSLADIVAQLEESSFLSTVIDTVNAVKYKQNIELYLGTDIFDFSSLSYTEGVWSVDSVNGTISYLGGSISPIVLQVATNSGDSYALECSQSNYVRQTETVAVSIGDGPKNDAYNGTNNLFVGAVSDGGYLKIWPIATNNTFTISGLSFRKKVSQGSAVVTKTFTNKNVNSGNSDSTLLDGKWNVAIGPAADTQAAAVSLTRSIAIGVAAQKLLQSGWQNIAIGTFAMDILKNGDKNIALGCDCLYQITHAESVIAIGKASVHGLAGQVSWNDPSTWQHVYNWVSIGTNASFIDAEDDVHDSVYLGHGCGSDGVGSKNTCIGSTIRGTKGKINVALLGYGARPDKSNQSVIGNSDTEETKVYGDLVVEGTDGVKRRIVFNNDNSCSWEVIN